MEPTKMRLRMRKKAGSNKALPAVTAEASPDSKCPICLDRFNNMAYLDRCLHKFCFRCIHEWSKNKAECPLCKQGFNSIFHTIKAEDDFKEFVLRPVENGSFGSPGGHRFRYRTTLTRERREAQRITSSPPDNGVIFEGLAGPVPSQPDRGVRRMMNRLAARRRAQTEGRTLRALREQEMIRFRRALYRTGVRVRSVRDGGRYRDTSAEFYRRNPACLHRLVPWLKRELTVLYGAHGSLVNIVQHIIMSWITRYDMEDQAMQEELRPFLLARTDHFLHEFISFARSPFNMEAYDQHAIYDCPAPSSLEDSSSDASVIAISEDEDELDLRRGPVAGGALSQAPWDDETPGPSYSTTEQAAPVPLAVSESESESGAEDQEGPGAAPQQGTQVKKDPAAGEDGVGSSSEEDCVIIGYVKPMVERTPELVQLSSDSEESVHNESPEAFPQPQPIRFPSLSPPSSSAGSMGSKPKSPPQRQANSHERPEAKDGDRSIVTSSAWGSPPPDRCRSSREMDPKSSKRHRKECRDRSERHRKRDGSRRRKSRSRERRPLDGTRRRSRSPTISIKSDSTLSRGRGRSRSRSRSRDCRPSRGGVREERRGRDDGGGSRRGRERRSHSRRRDSRSCYGLEKDAGYVPCSQGRWRYVSSPGNPDRWGRQSRSRSRTPTDPHRRDRRRSRSASSASSRGSRSPHRRFRHDKPGGKRKYKTRHLEDSARERSPGQRAPSSSSSTSRAKEKRRHEEKPRRRSQERSRSPSVEIVYEGRATGDSRRRHKKKKKHKKKSKRKKTREPAERGLPTVITINSDSDHSVGEEAAPLDLRCPESADEASAAPGSPGNTRLLESILQTWEESTQPVRQSSSMDAFKDEEAVTADNTKNNVPDSLSEQTSASPKDETNTSSSPKISTDSHLLSCL